MADDGIQHELGGLSASIKGLSENVTTWRAEEKDTVDKIFKKLDDLPEKCTTGKHLKERIANLEKRPERAVGLVATVVAVSSAVWATIKSLGH